MTHEVDSRYAWFRLGISLLLMTIGGSGMYAVIVVLPCVLVMLVEGRADPSLKMPHGDAKPLETAEIATIRQWVEQGAKNN